MEYYLWINVGWWDRLDYDLLAMTIEPLPDFDREIKEWRPSAGKLLATSVEQTTFEHDANAAIDRFEGDQVVVVCVS